MHPDTERTVHAPQLAHEDQFSRVGEGTGNHTAVVHSTCSSRCIPNDGM